VNDSRIKTCINRYDSGAYTPMQFLDAMSHNMGAHTAALNEHFCRDSDDDVEVCCRQIPLVPFLQLMTTQRALN